MSRKRDLFAVPLNRLLSAGWRRRACESVRDTLNYKATVSTLQLANANFLDSPVVHVEDLPRLLDPRFLGDVESTFGRYFW